MKYEAESETAKRKTAVALHYDGRGAPTVTAKGSGLLGDAIIRLAQENGIPLHQDSRLAEVLSSIPLGEEIPPEIFAVVAEILAYVYFLDETQAGKHAEQKWHSSL